MKRKNRFRGTSHVPCINAEVVGAIQKSGKTRARLISASGANRIDGERREKPRPANSKANHRSPTTDQRSAKEIARLQQSEAVAHARWRSETLAAIQQNHVRLHRSLEQQHTGLRHAFTLVALGQSLLVAMSQQLDLHLQSGAREKEG
jgi:hypothetical protein